MRISSVQPIEKSPFAARSSFKCSIALRAILEMMTSRKICIQLYKFESIVVISGGMGSPTSRQSQLPPTSYHYTDSRGISRRTDTYTGRNNTTLNCLTTHGHKQKTMMSGHLGSLLPFPFSFFHFSFYCFRLLIHTSWKSFVVHFFCFGPLWFIPNGQPPLFFNTHNMLYVSFYL